MLPSFLAGAVAGYVIAIPVGAIAVLIVETGIRRGFRPAAAAGAGAASADGLYALLAVIGGTALASLIEPIERPLRVLAVAALLALGLRGLWAAWHSRAGAVATSPAARPALAATYARFLGLTLLNPATVIYFAALILALPNLGSTPLERGAFAVGAFLASLSWQTTLAAIGAVAHHRLPPRFQVGLSFLGGVLILGFALILATDL